MKKNLAKVLGLEELQEVAPPDPTEDQIMQQQTAELSDYMQQTAAATDVALESIGNSLQLQSVIQNSQSTDPTAYAVLRTAVEQLKERTGVRTNTVALEDLSPLNYKTEALEDIKKFAAKVWEAIKKAFAAMWEKIKAFFKMLFDKEKNVEKEVNEVEKEVKEFEKEEDNLPKNEKRAESYKSDYFVKHTMLAIGHTPDTENKVHVKGSGFNTGEKQPEYSDKKYDKPGEFTSGLEDFRFSDNVYKFLASELFREDGMDQLKKSIIKVLDFNNKWIFKELELKTLYLMELPSDFIQKEVLAKIGKSSDFIVPPFGKVAISISYQKTIEINFQDIGSAKRSKVQVLRPAWLYQVYISKIETLFDAVNEREKDYLSLADKIDKELLRMKNSSEEYRIDNREKYEHMWSNFNRLFEFYVSYTRVFGQIKQYLISLSKALITFLRETMTFNKLRYASILKHEGYLREVGNLKSLGYVEE